MKELLTNWLVLFLLSTAVFWLGGTVASGTTDFRDWNTDIRENISVGYLLTIIFGTGLVLASTFKGA